MLRSVLCASVDSHTEHSYVTFCVRLWTATQSIDMLCYVMCASVDSHTEHSHVMLCSVCACGQPHRA